MRGFKDLTWKTFHWLTVIWYAGKKRWSNCWLCKCKCWKEVIRTASHLNENVKHSCWCRWWERHHLNWSHFHRKYFDARDRCKNTKNSKYKYYGWKWIKFEWSSFEEFMNDMYESYLVHVKEYWEKNTTIDRIDSNGNYCKENCRWATLKEQALNRSNMYEYNWKKISLADLAMELWTTYRCVSKRAEHWMSIEDIVKYYKEHPNRVKTKWSELKLS